MWDSELEGFFGFKLFRGCQVLKSDLVLQDFGVCVLRVWASGVWASGFRVSAVGWTI